MIEGQVQIVVPFGTRHPPSFMIENVFDQFIQAEPWRKWYREYDCATIYEVPKEWESWWRFWLADEFTPNAEAHGRAVARTVQPLVGSIEVDHAND
jgi:hypothetical protein